MNLTKLAHSTDQRPRASTIFGDFVVPQKGWSRVVVAHVGRDVENWSMSMSMSSWRLAVHTRLHVAESGVPLALGKPIMQDIRLQVVRPSVRPSCK